MRSSSETERRKLQIHVDEAKSTIENARRLSIGLNEPLSPGMQDYVDQVLVQLHDLRTQLDKPTLGRDELDAIDDRIKELARSRAYVMPSAEIRPETDMMVDDLRSMGLPAAVLDYQKKLSQQVTAKSLPDRAAFVELLSEYDYWDDYTDWYFGKARWIAFALCTVSVTATVLAVLLCRSGLTYVGFLFAGIVGTGVSILLKLPPMSVYGEAASLWFRIAGRYAAGVAGTLAGYGLLMLGVIHIGDNKTDLLEPCFVLGCWQRSTAIIVTIGLLFGFSERALASFEGIVFPHEEKK